MTTIRYDDLVESVAAALQYILLPPCGLHRPPGARLRARRVARGQGRHRADPDQLAHGAEGTARSVKTPASSTSSQDRDGREVGRVSRQPLHPGSRGRRACAAVTTTGQQAARLGAVRPHFERKNTKDNTPAVVHGTGAGQHVDVTVAAKGGGSRTSPKVRHAQPVDNMVGLGAQDRADHGRRLVPARHAGHRRRRHAAERPCCWPRNR